MAETREQQPGAQQSQVQRIPSPYKLDDDMAQVMVDVWGHEGEFHRGDIVRLSEIDASKYDTKSAVDRGVVRMLTEAEVNRPPTTRVLDANGEPDENHARSMRYHAGFIDEVEHNTVTTGSGPAEPPEFAKPTLQYSGSGGEPPYPIKVVSSPEEVTQPVPQTEQTERGTVYVSPEENEQRVGRRGRARE